ncbi:DUF6443 domain-containing protein [uncultured Chryseobacterium sp.]|uniref:DUF6443 domain-containing protein n=1 Tax=uncultured Chryseobacterium sp. TaxID=259322 RepID=UPI00258554D1|nr:DUF6443 domain-containing protein [uncultured Chryseobacterium sp.]
MKKLIIPIGILIMGTAKSQLTNTENYVYSKTYLSDPTLANVKSSETVQYFDGLGRPKQIVNVKASPLGKDVVTPIEYDAFGRQVLEYLPVPQGGTLSGGITAAPLANVSSTPYGTEKIYSEKIIENSPLNRILGQKQVGNAWDSKPVQFGYAANADGDVKKYTATFKYNNSESKLIFSGFYGTGQLYKNTVTDEDGNPTIEFKNGLGQVLLVRKVTSASENADTYYVYNDYNQLAYVIPPKASVEADPNTVLDDLCYQYKYDGRNRLIEKKLPGKGWEYMIYDKADQLVMSQDINLKAQGKWLLTKYDQFGRVVLTGITNNANTRQSLQTIITAGAYTFEIRSVGSFTVSGMPIYYTNRTLPGSIAQVLSVNYYDTYPTGSPAVTNVFAQELLTDNPANSRTTKGLPTASYIKNIEDDQWTRNFIWYDTKGRNIGSRSNNHLGGYTVVNNKLDFAGAILQTNTYHKRLNTDTEKTIVEKFTYDSQNRLLTHTHQVGSNPLEYLVQNKYNEISQLESKKVGGTAASPLQIIDYKYNIRGWMTKINDPANLNGKLFGYEIRYNNPVYTDISSGRFNGNIAEIDWKNSSQDILKRYNYTYDKLNRLTDAEYAEPEKTNPHNKNFDERLKYDLNGNITFLKRNAIPVFGATSTLVDDLEYKYTGNRLNQIIERSLNDTGYEGGNNIIDYDLNGNMSNMKDKGIQTIQYNNLNLPNSFTITQTDSSDFFMNSGLEYLYRADGVKLRKTYSSAPPRGLTTVTMTDYLDGFQYTYREGDGICLECRTETAFEEQAYKNINTLSGIVVTPEWKLDFVPTAEGFYSFKENRYIYQYKDHLGNARVSFAKNSEGALEVTDTNNYYPFGLNHIEGMLSTSNFGGYYSYKYNGKELQETGMYDYGARFYMPDIGRWAQVDPLSEKYRRYSTYNYTVNNPIRFIDPDGREIVLPGSKEAQDEYVKMLHSSTGNNYAIENNKLKLVEVDANFKGVKSQTLINTIQSGIDAKDVYTMNLVGDKQDDKQIFIDSYSEKKIDISDLKTLGNASTALQGAAIGHFLNEVQAQGNFDAAHQASLGVEGAVYGELVGDNTITSRKDYATGIPQNGFQTVIFEYNSNNRYELQQGATSTTKGTGRFIGTIEIQEATIKPTGEFKSVNKVK